jgi:hypothetical protein
MNCVLVKNSGYTIEYSRINLQVLFYSKYYFYFVIFYNFVDLMGLNREPSFIFIMYTLVKMVILPAILTRGLVSNKNGVINKIYLVFSLRRYIVPISGYNKKLFKKICLKKYCYKTNESITHHTYSSSIVCRYTLTNQTVSDAD